MGPTFAPPFFLSPLPPLWVVGMAVPVLILSSEREDSCLREPRLAEEGRQGAMCLELALALWPWALPTPLRAATCPLHARAWGAMATRPYRLCTDAGSSRAHYKHGVALGGGAIPREQAWKPSEQWSVVQGHAWRVKEREKKGGRGASW